MSSEADREADCAAVLAADREAASADAAGERVVGGMTATNFYDVAATSPHFVPTCIFLSNIPSKKIVKTLGFGCQ